MSRFDDELTRTADNAWQNSGAPKPVVQRGTYDQVDNMNLDGPFGLSSQNPDLVDDVQAWAVNEPAHRMLQVTDLDAAATDIMGGPGSSAVYASADESLYQVYKASRKLRDAIEAGLDFDFTNLFTAANHTAKAIRSASSDGWLIQTTAGLNNLVQDVETDLVNTGDYRQAYKNLVEFESLLEEMNKYAGMDFDAEDEPTAEELRRADETAIGRQREEALDFEESPGVGNRPGIGYELPNATTERPLGAAGLDEEAEYKPSRACPDCGTQRVKIPGKKSLACPDCHADKFLDSTTKVNPHNAKVITAKAIQADSSGRQETLQHDDVRNLDNAELYMNDNVMADATVDVTAPQVVNGEDAGYVDYYNDGAETGITPGQEPHKQEVFPYDATNPALAPYAGTVAAREKIFEALQVVERLEKLGMVQDTDRAKHIAKFEQMSDAKLAGFKASLDMLEESGARQPRSQKVASGNNRMPEMGRLTTASTSNRQSISSDDWLMTL